ncbi:unnamed protein product, partial [Ectocarpus fasciculatus]
QGLGRVLRAYVTVLSSWDWFCEEGGVWSKSLEVYRDACLVGSDSQEVSLSGVDGVTTMVLLVGRMGLKSVQVRAGAGMKIVDGTLQRSSQQQPARAGGRGGGNNNNNNKPAAERGEGAETESTPQFSAARPALYAKAWAAMLDASGFEADSGGDVAPAFVQGLAAVYKAGVEEGAELCPGQEGEEERMRQLFETLDGLFAPRVAPATASGGGGAQAATVPPRRAVYMPKVTPGQRAILEFLQDDLRTGWRLAVRLLAKYSVVGDGSEEASSAAAAAAAVAAGPGGVSVECVREAAAALSSVMSNGRVPKRDRAVALEGLLSDVSAPCVRRLEGLRKQKSGPDSAAAAAAGTQPSAAAAAAMPGAVPSATDAAVSSWPSLDSYSEVIQLVLALLKDGLPSVADPASFKDQGGNQERDKRLVSCLKGAIKGVGAVAECRRLKIGFLEKGSSLGSPQAGSETSSGGGSRGASGGAGGFPLVLREVLVLVTRAVRSELVPLVHKGSEDARDAARALIDTLGAIALVSSVDKPQPPSPPPCGEAAHSSASSSANNAGDSSAAAAAADSDCAVENSASSDAFDLAVDELAAMCSEGASAGSWAQLGFPLRRRACWHLLRCVWSTTYCFRRLEDEVDAAGAPARTSPEDMAQLRSSLAIGADR